MDRRVLLIAMGAAAAGGSVFADSWAGYDDPDTVYRALRLQPATPLRLDGGVIDVVFADGAPGLDRGRVLAWVHRSAVAISTYFGRYPVARHGLLVVAEPSARVGHATTFGYDGSATRIHVGVSADDAAFARDWVLVHEMTHTALPDLPRRALWLQEGNATYIEPIAQAQAGHLPVEDVWRQSLRGMPTGEPGPGDGGMDGTTAHGRLYWGGATFWLLAEVAIHDQSRGRRSLREALRAVNRTSGGNSVRWSPEQLMRVGDLATGTEALSTLYARFANSRVETDLPALFRRLGVMLRPDGGVGFDDGAPLAALRRSITQA
jgi:hypothetical protein